MHYEVADNFMLGGTARHNKECRWKLEVATMPKEEVANIPYHFREKPPHYDNSVLAIVNSIADCAGVETVPHPNIKALVNDTGENFFYKYFLDQELRQRTVVPVPNSDRCMCEQCDLNLIKISGATTKRREVTVVTVTAAPSSAVPNSDSPTSISSRDAHQQPVVKITSALQVQPAPSSTQSQQHLLSLQTLDACGYGFEAGLEVVAFMV